jgi:uncharacterized protein with ParB-like and HNH nuclease domain
MKAAEVKLSEILRRAKPYKISEYLRPYSCKSECFEEWMNDLYKGFESKSKEYLLGSIIVIETDDTFEIVDGEQHLTNLILFLAKLRDLLSNPPLKYCIQLNIMPSNALSEDIKEPKLLVRTEDRKFFEQYVLEGRNLDEADILNSTQQKIVDNWNKTENLLKNKSEESLMDFGVYLFERVGIIFVEIENSDSAYRFLNVLNSRPL